MSPSWNDKTDNVNLHELIDKVIPPKDFAHRNGFNNVPLLEELGGPAKLALEEALIEKLENQPAEDLDSLLVDTLGYLKSRRSVPVLTRLLDRCSDNKMKIVLATAIFEICQDNEVIPVAISALRQIDATVGPYRTSDLTSAFYYLARFKVSEINDVIDSFSDSDDFLIAYNARRALEA